MKTVLFYLMTVLAVGLLSCDRVEGLRPEEEEISKATASLIGDRFPDAANVTFRTIDKDRLWEARFDQGAVSYYAGLQTDKILAVHRLLGSSVPDSIDRIIRSNIPVARTGQLSDYRQELFIEGDTETSRYRAMLSVDGNDYLVKWNFNGSASNGKTRVQIAMHEYSIFEFDTDVRTEPLPPALKAFQDRTQYVVVKLKTKVLDVNKMHFHFVPENRDAAMVLDNEGVLIGSYNFIEGYKTFDEFPLLLQVRIRYFGTQNYQTSVFSGKFQEDNNTGYRILTWSDTVTADFFFDQNGGLPSFNYGLAVTF